MTYFMTADDEEPKCSECAHYVDCNGTNCGPENGWAYYIKYVIDCVIDKEKEDE